jgi:hypothetical protein
MKKIGSGAVLLLLLASSAYADPPPSDHIVIDVITVNGSGCPAGTAAVAVSPDNTAFTVTYSNYTAQVGVGAGPTDLAALVFAPCGVQRNLNVNTELRVAAGTSDPTQTTSFMTMDSTDGAITTTYHFAWQQCH